MVYFFSLSFFFFLLCVILVLEVLRFLVRFLRKNKEQNKGTW